MESIYTVAEWFLEQEPMTHKKLQKMCYYAQAWSYLLLDRPIISDDQFEAWIHGPVFPKLYKKFRNCGLHEKISPESDSDIIIEDPEDHMILRRTFNTYCHLSPNAIQALSQSETPWIMARVGLGEFEDKRPEINPNDVMNPGLKIVGKRKSGSLELRS